MKVVMNTDRYIQYLEEVTLSLLYDRNKRCESLFGNHSDIQSVSDTSVSFSPMNIIEAISHQRESRANSFASNPGYVGME